MNGKVLVVDDDPETRLVLSDLLAQLQVDHATVGSAAECLKRIVSERSAYAIVLMDIHMPNLSGTDASTWINGETDETQQNIPIIAMTGDTDYANSASWEGFGLQGHLPKPVSLEGLRTVLHKFGSGPCLN